MEKWSHLMLRVSHYLTLAAALLAQPALAQTHSVRSHHAAYRHHYDDAPVAYGHRDVGATLNEVARSRFYGPFGGYEDAHANWQYSGPNERHYFGHGWDPRFGYGPDRRSELEGIVEQQASANGVPASAFIVTGIIRYRRLAPIGASCARRWAAS